MSFLSCRAMGNESKERGSESNTLGRAFDDSVLVYSTHVVDAIRRIIENAFKFAGKDDPTEISVTQDGEELVLHVRDHGPGLPKGVMDQARDIFSQINREKLEQQGCGLGLSIATYFTRINGGTLLFTTPGDNAGLEVLLRFPSVPKSED